VERRRAIVAAALLGMALIGGCVGGRDVIERSDLERAVLDALRGDGYEPERIQCVGRLEAKLAESTMCVMSTSDGHRYGMEVTVMSVEGGQAAYEIDVDDKPMS
jgi:hypothetical protein